MSKRTKPAAVPTPAAAIKPQGAKAARLLASVAAAVSRAVAEGAAQDRPDARAELAPGDAVVLAEDEDEQSAALRQPATKPRCAPQAKPAAVEAAAANAPQDRATRPTVGSAHAEAAALLRQRLQEVGVVPVRIPKQAEKLRSAICALLRQLDEGRKPSAKRAAWEAGLTSPQGRKLAERVPIKREDVNAATCLMRAPPFARDLRRVTACSAS